MKYLFFFFLLVTAILSASAQVPDPATTRYVSTTGINTDPASATSWATSTTNLQGAINSLSATGGQVWVAAGAYMPGGVTNTDRSISFNMRNGVALYGGFEGTETLLSQRPSSLSVSPSTSFLTGDIGVLGVNTDNSRHVISNTGLDNTAILDGFVVTAAYLNGSDFGGGMWNQSSSPTIRNCYFTNHRGTITSTGGGIYNDATSSPIISNCTFNNNSAYYGGAITSANVSSFTLINCIFTNNSGLSLSGAIMGGKIFMTNCTLSGNLAQAGNSLGYGGAARLNAGSVLTNCLFANNSAQGYGGALLLDGNTTITNCTFRGNIAAGYGGAGNATGLGGAICNFSQNSLLINCSFSNNFAGARVQSGGGAFNNQAGSPTLINCSFGHNSTDRLGGAFYIEGGAPVLTNCIIWDNTPTGIATKAGASAVLTYTDTQDGTPGTGNLSLDPLLVNAADDNLRLKACSPAIDQGNPSVNTTTTDVLGDPRVVRVIDMGAYEFQGTPLQLAVITQQPNPLYSIPEGGTLTASVSATGSITGYQWYRNGVALTGVTSATSATSATLTLPNVTTADSGTYVVVVTSSCNSVTSTSFRLLVNTGMYSIKNGNWDDPTTWSLNRIPVSTDPVLIKYEVTIPDNFVAHAYQVSFDPLQRLLYGLASRLLLNQ